MHYVYFLKSDLDSKLCIGYTTDLAKRLAKHNIGKVPSTKYRAPLKLIYYEAFLSEQDAKEKEKFYNNLYKPLMLWKIIGPQKQSPKRLKNYIPANTV